MRLRHCDLLNIRILKLLNYLFYLFTLLDKKMHSQLSFSSSYIWYIFFQPYKTFFLLIFPYNFRVSLRLIKPLVRSKDDILLFCRSCQREKCTLVYRSISSFNVKMEVVRTYETLANFCPNACVCRDVREKYFLHTHARIHTQTHIHKHTHTHTFPPTHLCIHTQTHTKFKICKAWIWQQVFNR